MASYNKEFKKRIVRMHSEEGRTIKSLSEEYRISEKGIGYRFCGFLWINILKIQKLTRKQKKLPQKVDK